MQRQITSAADSLDPARQIKRATLSAGLLLHSKMKSAKLEKMSKSKTKAKILNGPVTKNSLMIK